MTPPAHIALIGFGEAELRSRNQPPGSRPGTTERAAPRAWAAVTALIVRGASRTASRAEAQVSTPTVAAAWLSLLAASAHRGS